MRDLDPPTATLPLRAILAQAAADGIRAGREAHPANPQEALTFVLGRIDTCVLGRRVILAIDGAPRLALDATGRRLLCVSAVGRPSSTAGATILDTPLSGSDPDHLAGVAALLTALCDGCKQISARFERPDAGTRPPATGLSVPALRDALALVPSEAPLNAEASLAARLGLTSASVLAEYTATGGWTPAATDDPDRAAGIAALQGHLDDPARLDTLLDEGSLLVLDLAPDLAAVITMHRGAPAALIVPRDAAAALPLGIAGP